MKPPEGSLAPARPPPPPAQARPVSLGDDGNAAASAAAAAAVPRRRKPPARAAPRRAQSMLEVGSGAPSASGPRPLRPPPPPRPASDTALISTAGDAGGRGPSPSPPSRSTSRRGKAPAPPGRKKDDEPPPSAADQIVVLPVEASVFARPDRVVPLHADMPSIHRRCIEFLGQPFALGEEGLFRVSGNQKEIARLTHKLRQTGDVDLNQVQDPAVVCGLLKQHLGRFHIPPCPIQQGRLILGALKEPAATRIAKVREAAAGIPTPNTYSFVALIRLLTKICGTQGNKMKPSNMATSVGLSLFPYLAHGNAIATLQFLLEHTDSVFPPGAS